MSNVTGVVPANELKTLFCWNLCLLLIFLLSQFFSIRVWQLFQTKIIWSISQEHILLKLMYIPADEKLSSENASQHHRSLVSVTPASWWKYNSHHLEWISLYSASNKGVPEYHCSSLPWAIFLGAQSSWLRYLGNMKYTHCLHIHVLLFHFSPAVSPLPWFFWAKQEQY